MKKNNYLFLGMVLVGLSHAAVLPSIDVLAQALEKLEASPGLNQSSGSSNSTVSVPSAPPSEPSTHPMSGSSPSAPLTPPTPPKAPLSGGPSGGPPGPPPPPSKGKGPKQKPKFENLSEDDIALFEQLKDKFTKPSSGNTPISSIKTGPVKTIEQEMQEKAIAVMVGLSPEERINRVNQAEEKELADIALAIASIPDQNERDELQQAIDARKKEIEEEQKVLALREEIEKTLRQLENAHALLENNIKVLEDAASLGKVSAFKITDVMKRFDEYVTKLGETEKAFEKYQKNPYYSKAIKFLLDSQKIKQKQLDIIQSIQQHRAKVYTDMIDRLKKLL